MSPAKSKAPRAPRPSDATRGSEKKSALPGARRGVGTFVVDPDELVIMGYDNDQKDHHLYDPSCHAPVRERLKRRIKKSKGNMVPVGVTREGDKVVVAFGRDRVKAMRELKAEALEAGETVMLVTCMVRRGTPTDLFEAMLDENEARKKDPDPITRAKLMNTAVGMLGEDGAKDVFECSLATINGAIKLLDLIPEVQEAVASGALGEIKARGMWGMSRQEQLDILAGKKAAPSRLKPPAHKKVVSALKSAESWTMAGGVKTEVVDLLKWFAGYITDEEFTKKHPHIAPEIKQKNKA